MLHLIELFLLNKVFENLLFLQVFENFDNYVSSRRKNISFSFSLLHKESPTRLSGKKKPRRAPQRSFSAYPRDSRRHPRTPAKPVIRAMRPPDRDDTRQQKSPIQPPRRAKRTSLSPPSALAQFSLPPWGKPPVATFWSAFTLTVYSETFLRSTVSVKYNPAMLHSWFMSEKYMSQAVKIFSLFMTWLN